MDFYKHQIKEILEEKVAEGYETRDEILDRWENGETEDDFGNLTGSRFCSRFIAENTLREAGFPFNDELNDLLAEVGYDLSILNKGAEAVDVILCELVVPYAIDELREK